jgi:large subunit ribosomal protein L3
MALKSLITKKIGMMSTINENGAVEAITLLAATDHTVLKVKTIDSDGYDAIQVGTGIDKKPSKATIGQYKGLSVIPKIIREFKSYSEDTNLNVGETVKADIFSVGDIVDATGISKGKGFAGTIKRHNFHRGRKTHGGRSYRRPGSIGSMYPQKVFKGKRMAGQMGNEQVTVKNLTISLVDVENNVIGVRGAVPGPRKGTILIKGVK